MEAKYRSGRLSGTSGCIDDLKKTLAGRYLGGFLAGIRDRGAKYGTS